MRINVLLPTGTRTVDLDELKELARQGVVQPSTLLETGGQRGKAKNVPALKPIFAELAAAPTQAPEPSSFPTIPSPSEPPRTVESPNVPSPPEPPEPPVFSPIPTSSEPPQLDAPSTFPDFSPLETTQPAPSFDDVYDLEDAAPPAFATETPSPEDAPLSAAAFSADDSNSPFYFDARSPIPLPKRFRKSKKGFYVGSLKALRSAELAHWVAWGRGFLRVFDVLFVVGVVFYLLVFLTSIGTQEYKSAKARQERQRSETFSRLYDALDELGLSDAPFSELEETKFAWIPLLLTRDTALTHEVTAYNFSSKSFEKQFEILEIAEKKSVELEKEFPKKLSQKQKELQSFFKEFRKDVKQARKLKKEYDRVPFPLFRFLGAMLFVALCATIAVALAAFVYGLATIIFRILLSAADLYAASFRDDFDPAANKRRDDLLASVETIKTNGAPATQDANAV